MAKHYSSSIVIVYGDKVLLRPNGRRTFQLIGGKARYYENPIQTANRESKEECGLKLDPQRLEKVHITKNKDGKHIFFLYRLTEGEANKEIIPGKDKRHPKWKCLTLVSHKMFGWSAYFAVIEKTKGILNKNLLEYKLTPALI